MIESRYIKKKYLCYCPECGHYELREENFVNEYEKTVLNLVKGYAHAIQHVKCKECENTLCGMCVVEYPEYEITREQEDHLIEKHKIHISNYNRGGCYWDEDIETEAESAYALKR